MNTTTAVNVLELKRLLFAIKDSRSDVCLRFRVLGELWQADFSKILQVTENGVVLRDDFANRLILVQELSGVMQFEIDKTFQQYQPHFHYTVTLSHSR
jgi:hypothetical protein